MNLHSLYESTLMPLESTWSARKLPFNAKGNAVQNTDDETSPYVHFDYFTQLFNKIKFYNFLKDAQYIVVQIFAVN